MTNYSLRFMPEDKTSETTLSFHAHSTAGALDMAKRIAEGDWADLYQRDALLCRLQLVEGDGVWRVIPVKSGENG